MQFPASQPLPYTSFYIGGEKINDEDGHKSVRHTFLLVMPLMKYGEFIDNAYTFVYIVTCICDIDNLKI